MTRRKSLYFASLAAAGALAVGACAAPTGSPEPDPSETTVIDPAPPTFPEPPAPPTSSSEPTPLGGTHTYDNGLAVSVSLAGDGFDTYTGEPYQKLTFSITNGTAENFEPALVSMTVHYGAAGVAADSHINLEAMPTPYFTGVILPGGTQTITSGYEAPAGEPLVVTVTPSWDHGPAVFTG